MERTTVKPVLGTLNEEMEIFKIQATDMNFRLYVVYPSPGPHQH